jgi:Putative Ig domain/Regulator of chromosome condensation (RCC1) repeat
MSIERLAKQGIIGDTYYMKKVHTWVGLYAGIALMGCLWAVHPVSAQTTHPMSWGMNANDQAAPIPTNTMDDADAIAGGEFHSLSLKDGRVWAWGENSSGQINVPTPAQSDITAIAGGAGYSLALNTSGGVVTWGSTDMVTGMPATVSSGVTEISAGSWHALALKDGGVIAWGSNTEGQCDVPLSLTSGVTSVSAGQYYSMALKDGGVEVFGIPVTNEMAYSIRSVPDAATSGVTAISAGLWHGLALKDGGVIAWGNPLFDATNVPPEATSNVLAIAAGDLYSIALKSDNTLVLWGAVSTNGGWGLLPLPPFAVTDITEVAAGGRHCLTVGTTMPPRFVTDSLPDAYVDEAYSGFVLAVGDPSVTYYEFGTWPGWVILDSMTGDIGGVAPTNGFTYFSVRASNTVGQVTNSYQLNALIRPDGPPVFVTTNPLPDGLVNEYYSLQIVASNSPAFSLVAGEGDLPDGLTLSTNGLVSGMPTTVQDLFFTVRATNLAGGVSNVYGISIKAPTNPPVFVTTNPLPMGVVGEPYAMQLVVSNGGVFNLFAGSLPSGLSLTSSGMVTGTPTQIDSANFTVQATNAVGVSNQVYDLEIEGPPVFQTTSPLPDGTLGLPYTLQLDVDGDPLFSVITGSLPGGVTLNAVGLLNGTPTATGDFNFTVHATNDYGWSNRVYDLAVEERPIFSTTNPLPTGKIAEYYSLQFVVSGLPTFSLAGGSVPSGMTLNSGGFLSGVPVEAGPFNFTVHATNAYGWSNRVYDVVIDNFDMPSFTYIQGTSGAVWLEWTNANLGGSVQVWSSPSLTTNITWSNLGAQTSPWTNTSPSLPSYYQLRMVP